MIKGRKGAIGGGYVCCEIPVGSVGCLLVVFYYGRVVT